MDWLWDLISKNFWLVLILLGVVGQVFTPNPKKRQQARERERAKRLKREAELSGQRAPMGHSEPQERLQEPPKERPRAQPEDIAERIRELFEGKRGPVSEVEDFPNQAPVLEMPSPVAVPQSRSTKRSSSRPDRLSGSGGARSEAEVSQVATRGSYDPHLIVGSIPGSSVPQGAALGRGQASVPNDPDRGWAIKTHVDRGFSLDPRDAVRALLILGPPRALASYEEDPLLSRYQSMIGSPCSSR